MKEYHPLCQLPGHICKARWQQNRICHHQAYREWKEVELKAPLFSDCTGDGTIGYLAGADYNMGRESRAEYGEELAPIQPDKMTMGSSVQWYSADKGKPTRFPIFSYGLQFNEKIAKK